MKKFGLIGYPIADSGSPRLFEAAYGGRYSYDLIEGDVFEDSYGRFLKEYDAINVTAPFKEKAFAQALALTKDGLGALSGPCLKTGATNLMVKTQGGMMAYNTDFTGIILSVAEALFPGIIQSCYSIYGDRAYIKVHQYVKENLDELYPLKPQALVVGCGGAGKAAAVAAAEMGFSTTIMNRTREKARDIALSLPEYSFLDYPIEGFVEAFRECDLVIYTLPVPIPAIASLKEEDLAGAPPKVILEANYKTPAFDEGFIKSAGARYIPGSKWLLYQALTGYGLMTGNPPDLDQMEKAL